MTKLLLLTTALFAKIPVNTAEVYNFLEPVILYTEDSAYKDGVSFGVYYTDESKESMYLEFIVDLPEGYKIYDLEETEYIEGILVNGTPLASNYIYKNFDSHSTNIVNIKTIESYVTSTKPNIFEEGFDWEALLTDPITLLQVGYYVLAAFSIIVGGIGMFKSKKYKNITSNQWAETANSQMQSVITKATDSVFSMFDSKVTGLFNNDILPILQQTLTNEQNIIKAIAVSTSKSENAPIAVLDILEQITDNVDTTKIIAKAKEAIEEAKKERERILAETKQALSEIAEENSKVETEETDSSIGRY